MIRRGHSWWFVALFLGFSGALCPCLAAGKSAPVAPAPVVPDTASVARMSVPQAIAAAARGEVVLVDVRPLPQRKIGHVKDDVSVPIGTIGNGAGLPGAGLPASKKLLFYCSCVAEELALEAARVAIASGRTDVAVLVGGFDAWRAAGGLIAVDETWEQSFRVDTSPVGWGKTPVDSLRCTYSRDDLNYFSGKSSGRIGCYPDTSARGLAGLVQRLDASSCLGRTVTLTAAVRGQDVQGAAFLWIGAEDARGKLIVMKRAEQAPIRRSQEWHFVQVSAEIPPDAGKLLIGLSIAGAGQVWLDEVKVKAEATDLLPVRPLIVKNPGFEE